LPRPLQVLGGVDARRQLGLGDDDRDTVAMPQDAQLFEGFEA
jgi:hypothetical protein